MKTLYTERLVIRRWEACDAAALIQIANQEHVHSWLPDWRNAEKWVRFWIAKVRNHYDIDNPMTHPVSMAVALKATDQVIGQINAAGFQNKEIGTGYFIDEHFKNCGYITEAMACFIAYLFDQYPYDHIIATIQPLNESSKSVAAKLGFRYVSTIRMLDDGQTEVLPFDYYRLDHPAYRR
ncbi:MAG: acetyltransferase, ribosomal protein N-acetylase [Paenibacillaceae bacterium]|jgi:RimJ/RimL family protein N-acetyltransferase|nr:acetyltransferase, ribosomal protein N-acetylase [Paenibacillaceae bacterium]